MDTIVDRIPNTRSVNLPTDDEPKKRASGKSAKEYRLERDELSEKLDEANAKIVELQKEVSIKYQSGYHAGLTKGQKDAQSSALESNQEAWYKRAMAAEYESKKLKELLGEVTKVIIRGAL